MVKHKGVSYSVCGGAPRTVNVVTKQDGPRDEPAVAAEIRQILEAEHEVRPGDVRLLQGPPPAPKPKPKASAIRRLNKAQLLTLIDETPELKAAGIPIDNATNKDLEDAIIGLLGLVEE